MSETQTLRPAIDLLERDDHLLLLADLPGAQPDSLDLELDGQTLALSADAPSLDGEPRRYSRRFKLGRALDPERITAKLTDGVLEVTLTKTTARKIPISAP